jgi:hypothetical protein
MLTIQLNDARLEAQLAQRAQIMGKPTQQLAEELLAEALKQVASSELSFSRLDPRQHSQALQFDIDPATDDAPAFQHVSDTVEYSSILRSDAWRR